MARTRTALIVGAGDAAGSAIAREGYATCVTRRSLDKLQPLVAPIEQVESTVGPIEVMVFNIGANVPESILAETARKYFKVWEMACFSGFLNGREVAHRARCAEGRRWHPESRAHRRRLLDAAQSAARCMDARTRHPSLVREILR